MSSAGIAPLMTWLVSSEEATVTMAMSQSMLLPALAAALGLIMALFLVAPQRVHGTATSRRRPRAKAGVAL
ncbi:hypothetical protein C6A85_88330 [Mycobacterium sp. ITM-2017-0098]|nr:hypothetical protein C6A85_88330 [Mycobacterium sp. ITM-2017-0098]